jgi:hypothetical protein
MFDVAAQSSLPQTEAALRLALTHFRRALDDMMFFSQGC